jgi:uncharacterized oxidoreductase
LDETNKIGKQFQEVDIDVNGVLRGVHYFLPQLKKKEHATLMIVSSALAYVPYAKMPVYCGAKAFLHSYTQSLRFQLKKTNINVIELLPPLVETPMTADFEKKDGFEAMPVDKFVASVRKSLDQQKDEITPGQAGQMRFMSRFFANTFARMVNKEFLQ